MLPLTTIRIAAHSFRLLSSLIRLGSYRWAKRSSGKFPDSEFRCYNRSTDLYFKALDLRASESQALLLLKEYRRVIDLKQMDYIRAGAARRGDEGLRGRSWPQARRRYPSGPRGGHGEDGRAGALRLPGNPRSIEVNRPHRPGPRAGGGLTGQGAPPMPSSTGNSNHALHHHSHLQPGGGT